MSCNASRPPSEYILRAFFLISGDMVGNWSIPLVTASIYIMDPPHITAKSRVDHISSSVLNASSS